MTGIFILLALGAQEFDRKFRQADGPASLRALEAASEGEERERVRAVLARIKPAGRGAKRETARRRRAEAAEAVQAFREESARQLGAAIGGLVAWMRANRHAPSEARARVRRMTEGLSDRDPEKFRLQASVDALEHDPAAEKKASRAFDKELHSAMAPFTTRLMDATRKCLSAGEPGLAFDLFRFLLTIDPDNRRAHQALGEARVGDRWLRPFELRMARAGFAWDDRFGWFPEKARAPYEAGELLDFRSRRWRPIEEANRLHSDPKDPWVLESEHFELYSTADLDVSARVLARMERFFLQVFRQYDLFFGGRNSSKLIFGVAPSKRRLKVWFYRDREQYLTHARPPFDWSAGIYDSGRKSSFFYAQGGGFETTVLQHELTHQILAEFSGEGHAPTWLAEGAAVYVESAGFQGGALAVPEPRDNYRISGYRSGLRAGGSELKFRGILKLRTTEDWGKGDIRRNYRGVGALFGFLMHFDGGRYRADALEMLRDGYHGGMRKLEDYFGLSLESLEFLMDRFYRDCEPVR